VNARHSLLAFIYEFFTPTIQIDGERHRCRWGSHLFDVAPGTHTVSVSYPWLFSPECGKATTQVEVAPGETKTVTYRAGLIRYLPGKMTVK
jgi:hypothetical protein